MRPVQEVTDVVCWAGLFILSARRKRAAQSDWLSWDIGAFLLVEIKLWRMANATGNGAVRFKSGSCLTQSRVREGRVPQMTWTRTRIWTSVENGGIAACSIAPCRYCEERAKYKRLYANDANTTFKATVCFFFYTLITTSWSERSCSNWRQTPGPGVNPFLLSLST